MRYARIVSLARSEREASLHNLAVSRTENFVAGGVALHNCRCALDFMSWQMLKDAGRLDRNGYVKPARVPSGGGPDPGFKHAGRPDIALYLGMI